MRRAVGTAFNIGGMGRGGGRGGGGSGGAGGFGEEEELASAGKLARAGAIATVVYEAAKFAYGMPERTAALLGGRLSNAQPYTSLRQGAANAGIAYGYNGNDLASQLYPGDGSTPAWMTRYGATPQSAMGVLGAFGMPTRSPGGIVQSAYGASRMPWLGGMEPERYAQSLGTQQQLGTAMSPATYWEKLQKVMAAANTIGLDRSQVLSNIESASRATASMNTAGGANIGAAGDLWWRVASGGSTGGRTGEAQMSIAQANAQFTGGAGFGGNVNASMMMHTYFQRNGGIPKTREALEKHLGVSYENLAPTDKAQFDSALDAAQHGNEAAFFTLMAPFMSNPTTGPGLTSRMAEGSGLVPGGGYMRPLLGGAYTGQTPYQYNQMNSGSPMGVGDPGNRHNPLNLRYHAGQGSVNTPSGFGAYQSDEAGVAAAQRQLMLYRGRGKVTLADIISTWAPPNENDTARYIAGVSQETGWKPDQAIDVSDPAQAAKLIGAMSARETHRLDPGVISRGVQMAREGGANMNPDINPLTAAAGQAETGAAEKSLREGQIALNTVGQTMLSFSSYVTQATRAVADFTQTLQTGRTPSTQSGAWQHGSLMMPTVP
jgi:hypothetical protein